LWILYDENTPTIKGVYYMLSKEKMSRINELARKAKGDGLSKNEEKEQQLLRQEYIQTFRKSMSNTLKNVTVIDPEGNDVTPEKIKKNRMTH
jgi:uncharacterized protein YnzC (UPF0291/DUF896 family)